MAGYGGHAILVIQGSRSMYSKHGAIQVPALQASGLPKAQRNMDRAQWSRHLVVFPANLETGTTQLCSSFAPARGKKAKRKLIHEIATRTPNLNGYFKVELNLHLESLKQNGGDQGGGPSLKRSCCNSVQFQLLLQSPSLPRSSSSTPAITWAFLQSEKPHLLGFATFSKAKINSTLVKTLS